VFEIRGVGALAPRTWRNPSLGDSRPVQSSYPQGAGAHRSLPRLYKVRSLARGNPFDEANVSWFIPATRARYQRLRKEVLTHRLRCCRSRSTMSCARRFRFRSGASLVASPQRETAPGGCDIGRRITVAKPRYRRRPSEPFPKKEGNELHGGELPKGTSPRHARSSAEQIR